MKNSKPRIKLKIKDMKLNNLIIEHEKLAVDAVKLDAEQISKGNLSKNLSKKICGQLRELQDKLFENAYCAAKERLRFERNLSKIKDPEIRLIARLRIIEGLSFEEIGLRLHIDRSSVSRKFRQIQI